MPNMIKVWPWIAAPKKFKKLSKAGGDEDWLAYVPGEYNEMISETPWILSLDTNKSPQIIQLANGDYIYIGSH